MDYNTCFSCCIFQDHASQVCYFPSTKDSEITGCVVDLNINEYEEMKLNYREKDHEVFQ